MKKNNKGFTLGDTTSTSYTYYGRFNGVGMSNPVDLDPFARFRAVTRARRGSSSGSPAGVNFS